MEQKNLQKRRTSLIALGTKGLILMVLLTIVACTKTQKLSFSFVPKNQYEHFLEIKDKKQISKLKINLNLEREKDVIKINKKINELNLQGNFLPIFSKKNQYQAQIVGSKENLDFFIKYLQEESGL